MEQQKNKRPGPAYKIDNFSTIARYLKKNEIFSVAEFHIFLKDRFNVQRATCSNTITKLVKLGYLERVTGHRLLKSKLFKG